MHYLNLLLAGGILDLRQTPAESRGAEPENDYYGRADEHGSNAAEDIPDGDAYQSSDYRRAGIKMLYEYIRTVSGHHVAQYTSAYAGHNAYKDEQEDAVTVVSYKGCVYTDHGEDPKTC